MPRLDLRGIPDLDLSLRGSAWVELSIGVTGQPGANNFAVYVGTPEAVLEFGREFEPVILVREWSTPDIEHALRKLVARCDTGEWRMSVEQLERHFHHEYRDYDEVPAKLPVVPMLKSIDSASVHPPSWEPLDGEPVYLELELTIGVRKQPDDHEYVVTIATPAGLRAKRSSFVLADRAVLLISAYRWDEIAERLTGIVERCRGNDWAHCRRKLDRHFDQTKGLV